MIKTEVSVKKWYIVQIKSNSYDLAVRNLERQGFETFLPKNEVTIKTWHSEFKVEDTAEGKKHLPFYEPLR